MQQLLIVGASYVLSDREDLDLWHFVQCCKYTYFRYPYKDLDIL